MAWRGQINQNMQTDLRHIKAQGADVGDRALGTDGRVYDWSGVNWNLAGDQTGATNTAWLAQLAKQRMINDITNIINQLEDKLNAIPGVSITQKEMDAFLQKAIAQVKPYYDKKLAEVNAGIAEGRLQKSEEMLKFLRDTQNTYMQALSQYDLEAAKTNEQFINTLANMTATRDEDLSVKRDDWRNRIDTAKMGLVKSGILTSGIGLKQLRDLGERQKMEEDIITRTYGQKIQEAETGKKYGIDKIQLARQQAEAERLNKVGTPEQQAALEAEIRKTMGLGTAAPLPSDVEMEKARAQRNITIHKPEEITTLQEQQRVATESRRLELAEAERAVREAEYQKQRQAIEAQIARKQRELQSAYAM